jgi:hypothetical protein
MIIPFGIKVRACSLARVIAVIGLSARCSTACEDPPGQRVDAQKPPAPTVKVETMTASQALRECEEAGRAVDALARTWNTQPTGARSTELKRIAVLLSHLEAAPPPSIPTTKRQLGPPAPPARAEVQAPPPTRSIEERAKKERAVARGTYLAVPYPARPVTADLSTIRRLAHEARSALGSIQPDQPRDSAASKLDAIKRLLDGAQPAARPNVAPKPSGTGSKPGDSH